MVEIVLAQVRRQQLLAEGALATPLFADEGRHELVAMKHIHLQPVGDS